MKTVAVSVLLWIGVCQAIPQITLNIPQITLNDAPPGPPSEDALRPFDVPELPFAPSSSPEEDEQSQSALYNFPNEKLYQGDIVLTEEQERLIKLGSSERNAVKYEIQTWIPVNRVIPFEFAPNTFTEEEKTAITEWVKDFEKNTCLTVKPRTNEVDYVLIVDNPFDCSSAWGRTGGMQTISLGRPIHGGHCIFKMTVLHEFMHAAGFLHEHQRLDRDNYIHVAWQNINKTMLNNFNKAPPVFAQDIGTYDYQSIMQYPSNGMSVSKNKKTMIRLDGSYKELGSPFNATFTEEDVYKLNTLYKCGKTVNPRPPTPPTTPRPPPPAANGESCEEGAKIDQFCVNNKRFCSSHKLSMHQFCRNTCGLCEKKVCEDIDKHCEWSAFSCKGWMRQFASDYMKTHCAKTCDFCKP